MRPIKKFTLLIFLLLSCGKVNFTSDPGAAPALDQQPALETPTPAPVPPAPPDLPEIPSPVDPAPPLFTKSQGDCAANGSTRLLSCFNCQVPTSPKPGPPLSRKTQELMNIMVRACQFRTRNEPAGYTPPDLPKLLERFNRCSPSAYEDTPFKEKQEEVVKELLKPESALLKKLFQGDPIYYVPPYADHFATYFGLDIVEAVYTICYVSSGLTQVIYPREALQQDYPWEYPLPPVWVEANKIRRQLRACRIESWQNPYLPPPPPKHFNCSFDTLEGPNGLEITNQVANWINNGDQVGFESSDQRMCGQIQTLKQWPNFRGLIKVAAYRCKQDQ